VKRSKKKGSEGQCDRLKSAKDVAARRIWKQKRKTEKIRGGWRNKESGSEESQKIFYTGKYVDLERTRWGRVGGT